MSLKIIRNDGIQGLNARRIAKELGCSTQPIFYYYESMDDIKIGEKLEIHCYKHNGHLHRQWDEAVLLEINDDYLKFLILHKKDLSY